MTSEFTAEEWAETLRGARSKAAFGDDDLRSMTLGAIRSLVNKGGNQNYEESNAVLASIRAALEGLDLAINE